VIFYKFLKFLRTFKLEKNGLNYRSLPRKPIKLVNFGVSKDWFSLSEAWDGGENRSKRRVKLGLTLWKKPPRDDLREKVGKLGRARWGYQKLVFFFRKKKAPTLTAWSYLSSRQEFTFGNYERKNILDSRKIFPENPRGLRGWFAMFFFACACRSRKNNHWLLRKSIFFSKSKTRVTAKTGENFS